MNLLDLFQGFIDLAAEEPLFLLVIVLALGGSLGAITIRGFSLGPAAVLFTALALSAFDERLRLDRPIGVFGLAMFAYIIGVGAGPSFFNAFKSGGRVITATVVVLLTAGVATVLVGHALGIEGPLLAGLYAGALTNTPALAAATQAWGDLPTVGYSVTYLFGTIGMLIGAMFALKTNPSRSTPPAEREDPLAKQVASLTVRIEAAGLPTLGEITERFHGHLLFSRIMRGDRPDHPGQVFLATDDLRPVPGDILTVVGDPEAVDTWTIEVGHPSTVAITYDRSALDYRRIALSNAEVAGKTLGELKLQRRFGAAATRVRRGDVDLLASDDLALQLGDRVRVVAPPERMGELAKYFGDSEKGAASLSLTSLATGMLLGVMLGLVEVPLPGGGVFALGMAGGPLVVGLFLGRAGRTGKVLWTIPHSAASGLQHIGLMLFLAYAGSNSGAALAETLVKPIGVALLFAGAVVTATAAVGHLLLTRHYGGIFGAKLAGVMAGSQTQPAVLAYANQRSLDDPRVNLGYALAYPVGMIVKVMLAPLLGRF